MSSTWTISGIVGSVWLLLESESGVSSGSIQMFLRFSICSSFLACNFARDGKHVLHNAVKDSFTCDYLS